MAKVMVMAEEMSPTDDEVVLVLISKLINDVVKYRIPEAESFKSKIQELVQRVYSIGCRDMRELVADGEVGDKRFTKAMAELRKMVREETLNEVLGRLKSDLEQKEEREESCPMDRRVRYRMKRGSLVLPAGMQRVYGALRDGAEFVVDGDVFEREGLVTIRMALGGGEEIFVVSAKWVRGECEVVSG